MLRQQVLDLLALEGDLGLVDLFQQVLSIGLASRLEISPRQSPSTTDRALLMTLETYFVVPQEGSTVVPNH